jgi:hypothetical protein
MPNRTMASSPSHHATQHLARAQRRATGATGKAVAAAFVAALLTLSTAANTGARAADSTDTLYVGDADDNTVKRFDAATGAFLGDFVDESGSILRGPRGQIFDAAGNLLVSDQHVDQAVRGEILQYSPLGKLLRRLVPNSDKNAPAVPRGIVLLNGFIYVADFSAEFRADKPVTPGRLLKYANDGTFVQAFVPPVGLLQLAMMLS